MTTRTPVPAARPRRISLVAAATAVAAVAGLSGLPANAQEEPTGPTPTAVATGETTGTELPAPGELEFDEERLSEVTWLDGETLETGSETSPYQVYRFQHSGGSQEIRWSGLVDPSRSVSMYVWEPRGNIIDRSDWTELTSVPGAAPDNSVLSATVSDAHTVEEDGGNIVYVAVQGRDTWATGEEPFTMPGEETVTGEFPDPDSYDFAMAHVTDTQFLSEGAVDDSDPEAQQRFVDAYRMQMEWIRDNADERKIAYTAHTGDLIENYMIAGLHSRDGAREEFEFASEMQAILDEACMPNGVLPGNHDNLWGWGFSNDIYNEFFHPERYEQASQCWENAEYGGPWREGDNAAHYDLFSAGGEDFIAVHLPYGHSTLLGHYPWANEVLAAYPDRNAIILTHQYLRASDDPEAASGLGRYGIDPLYGFGGNAPMLRERVVNENDNVFLVLSGHYHGVAWEVNYGNEGSPTTEVLADYQNYEIDGERSTGFMRLLTFDLEAGEMRGTTYSPRLDTFDAIQYDTGSREYGRVVDEFTIPVNLNTRTTTVQTDQIFLGQAPAAPEEELSQEKPSEEPRSTEEAPPTEEPTEEATTTEEPSAEPTPGDEETPSVEPEEDGTPTEGITPTEEPSEEPTPTEETTPTEEPEATEEPSEEASPTAEETPVPPAPVAQCEISGGTWDELGWEAAGGDLSEETTGQLELLSDEAAPGTAVEGVLSAEAAANCSELVAAVFPGGAGTDEPGLPVEISAVWEDGSIVFELPEEEELPAGEAALAVYSTEGDLLGWATLEILSTDEFPEPDEILEEEESQREDSRNEETPEPEPEVENGEAEVEVEVELSSSTVRLGEEFTVTGSGLEPGEPVSVTLNPTLAELDADADGSVAADVIVGEELEAGEYSLVVTGAESERSGSAEIEVLPAEAAEDEAGTTASGVEKPGAPLAQTGAGTAMMVGGLALALILTGGVLLALRRRQG